jgi:hypothetical protein
MYEDQGLHLISREVRGFYKGTHEVSIFVQEANLLQGAN